MASKDQQSRRAGQRQASKELEEVALQVARAAVADEEEANSTGKASEQGIQSAPEADEERRPTGTCEKAVPVDNTGEPARAVLHRLRTPARSQAPLQASPKTPGLVSSGTSKNVAGEGKAGVGSQGLAAQPKPRGPEPWGLSDPSVPAPPAQRGGYREWLQARGQQAMQRSRLRSCAPPPPGAPPSALPPAVSLAPPPPPGAAPVLGLEAVAGCQAPGGWSPAVAARSPTAMALPLQPPLQLAPGCGQQAVATCCGQHQVMMEATQGGPPFYGAYQQVPVASPAQSPVSCGGSPTGQDLMARFMPEAFAMDRDQLAEQLRAATPCCYDD
mmetsp:Transcript_101663/g.282989  ORF Transcript_101663/g.282989 Transcript_101663/m.282989 type:complete len:329 (-) Transcript_101663:27-1013(-)